MSLFVVDAAEHGEDRQDGARPAARQVQGYPQNMPSKGKEIISSIFSFLTAKFM